MTCKAYRIENDGGVTTYWRDGHKHATCSGSSRGGCLSAGVIILRNLSTGETCSIASAASWDYAVGSESEYLASLYVKHMAS